VRPAWHPAGLQLAVIARAAGWPSPHRAWLVAADGSGSSRLIRDDAAEEQTWVSWAPTGLALAVETSNDVLLVSPLGVVLDVLEPDRLTRPDTPVWSPDGTHVFVNADDAGGAWKPELWALPLVGDDVRQLTTDSSVFPTTATAVDPGLARRIIGTSPADTAVEVADRLPDSAAVVLTTPESAPAATPLAVTEAARCCRPPPTACPPRRCAPCRTAARRRPGWSAGSRRPSSSRCALSASRRSTGSVAATRRPWLPPSPGTYRRRRRSSRRRRVRSSRRLPRQSPVLDAHRCC
jgi:hypothetical protein